MKKIIALLLLLTIGISSFSMPTFAQEDDRQWQLGDTTHNFDISITDATEIQKYLAGLSIPSTNEEPQGCVCCVCADVNEDGVIDIKDVTETQKYLADIETDTRCGTVMENYNNSVFELTGEEEQEVKNAYINTIPNYDIEIHGEIMPVLCYGVLSDGSKLVRTRSKKMVSLDMPFSISIKNYVYIFDPRTRVSIFINNQYYTIDEAYKKGIISDFILDEIAKKIHFILVDTGSN